MCSFAGQDDANRDSGFKHLFDDRSEAQVAGQQCYAHDYTSLSADQGFHVCLNKK